jgi:hypothetical protein
MYQYASLKLVNFVKTWLFSKDFKIEIKGTLQYSKVNDKILYDVMVDK